MQAERTRYEKLIEFEQNKMKKLETYYQDQLDREQKRHADYLTLLTESQQKEKELLKKDIENI